MALALANVELADTFNTWRIRTNDIITTAVPAVGEAVVSANVTFTANVTAISEINAADFNTTSDVRLKENIVTADGSKVYSMRGVNYTKDGYDGTGVIAQELNEVAPELVKKGQDGYMLVKYDGLSGYLIEAIKDLQNQINSLKKQLDDQ